MGGPERAPHAPRAPRPGGAVALRERRLDLRCLDLGDSGGSGGSAEEVSMITATVRYKLPPSIDYAACRAHFHKIAPGFQEVPGLISKHFIWSESGWAGGVYQWQTRQDAKQFYSGPWLDGIVERYGMLPQIEFYEVFALTDNARGTVELFEEPVASSAAP